MDAHLLPGFGGKITVTIATDDAVAEVFSDVIDCSRAAQMVIAARSQTGGGAFSLQVYQSFDTVNFIALGAPITAINAPVKFDVTDGPHGLIKFGLTFDDSDSASDLDSSSSLDSSEDPTQEVLSTEVTVEVIGWPVQMVN
jgi:hypothetical protein